MTKRLQTSSAHSLLIVASLIIIIPLFFIFNIAFKTPREFIQDPIALAQQFDFTNFITAWERANMQQFFINSIVYTVAVSALTIVIGIMVAYPISRRHIRYHRLLYVTFTAGLFLPLSLVPTVFLMDYLQLMNTRIGYVLLTTALRLPLAIVVFVGFIRSVPSDLDEAAAVDGCGYFRYIFTILMPLMAPAIATVTTLSAIATWNDFINPFLYLTDPSKRPVTSGLYVFFGQYANEWTLLSAAIIIIALPLIIMFIFLQRYIISGIASGAVKG